MLAEFCGACALKTCYMARELNNSHLHAQAQTQIRLLVLSCVADSLNLALDTSVAEAAGNNDTVNLAEDRLGGFRGDFLGVDELDMHVSAVCSAGMSDGFHNGDICVRECNVLADKTDGQRLLRILLHVNHVLPLGEVRLPVLKSEVVACGVRQTGFLQHKRNRVQ